MLTGAAAGFLDAAVVRGLNIVVAGGTQAGKTTFVNALLGAVPGHERIITCEEVFELRLQNPDCEEGQYKRPSIAPIARERRVLGGGLSEQDTDERTVKVREGESM